MNVTAPTGAALLQALMPPDTAAPADPAAPAAGGDFAMMMAGVATPPVAPTEDADADADVAKTGAKDQDDRDGDDGEAPDAVLLAMLAITPPPAPPAPLPVAVPVDPPASAAADVQAPATVSTAARTTARNAAAPAARPDTADRAQEVDRAAVLATDPAPDTPIAAVQPDTAKTAPTPTAPVAAAPAASSTPAAPPSATTAIRKAIAAVLGLKQADPATAGDVAASAILVATDGAESRHAHAAADASTSTDDERPDADAPAIALAAPSVPPIAIASGSPAAVATDGASPSHRHPAADVAAQLGEHHFALAQGDGWLDQLARDISATAAPDGKLHFRLSPERLGSLHVEVARGAEGAAVRLTADSSATRDILVDAQPQLLAQAQAQGVRIAGTHVDLGTAAGGQGGGQGWGGQQPGRAVPQVRALGGTAAAATIESAGPRSAASERYA